MTNNQATIISILGCGWYGLPAGHLLSTLGYRVNGSTRSIRKMESLSEYGIFPYLAEVNQNEINAQDDFFECDILLVSFPPAVKGGDPSEYLQKIRNLIKRILKSPVKEVLFISSISIYGDQNAEVDEDTTPLPETSSGKALLEAENLLKNESDFRTTILRFAGLVGPGRHPGRFLSGKKQVPDGDAPVNLVHLRDCLGITREIITNKVFGHTFNICAPDHPSRKDFYTLAAQTGGFAIPEFSGTAGGWKIVNSRKIPSLLSWRYSTGDWLHYLPENGNSFIG